MKGNPYVGPRPYERSDRQNFYGREREARELQALVTAEREVLVYAQSGAGKTSLFNARVIPALEEQGFEVLPVARVGADLPPSIDPATVPNVFVFSALLTLAGADADPAALLTQTLPAYLLARQAAPAPAAAEPAAAGVDGSAAAADLPPADDLPPELHPPVLIFDQFEELFTTHRERWQEARGFFEQVRAALNQVAGLGVVFSMREEFLAALDPYLAYFPARLRARFRLELLGERGALTAITAPAQSAGLPFAPGVAEKLVDDLRRTKVQGPNGEESVLGEVVEPVNLQVVCSQLWTSLPDDKTGPIQWEEVQQYGSVDAALSTFYDAAVLQSATVMRYGQYLPGAPLPPASQRRVREWVAGQLITSVGTRGLALRGDKETAGLPNEAVEALEDLHLIRAEVRAGARWYELAHDRLIDPILKSNQAWERKRETPLRVTARRWKETGDKSLLYRGNVLAELKEKVELQAVHPIIDFDMEEDEFEFYNASLAAEAEFRKRRRQIIGTGIGGLVLLLLMAGLTIFAFQSRQLAAQRLDQVEVQRVTAVAAQAEAVRQQGEAMRQKNEAEAQKAEVERQKNNVEQQKVEAQRQAYQARAREVTSYASSALARGEPNLAALLAMQGITDYGMSGPQRFMAGEQVLRNSLATINGQTILSPVEGLTLPTASPDGRWMVGQNARQELLLWEIPASLPAAVDAAGAIPGPRVLVKLPYKAAQIQFSRSGRYLAVADMNDRLRLWDLQPDSWAALSRTPLVFSVAGIGRSTLPFGFSQDERWLLTVSVGGSLTRWFIQDDAPATSGEILMKDAAALSISPDGRWMSVRSRADSGGVSNLSLWDLSRPYTAWEGQWIASDSTILAGDFSENSRFLLDATDSNTVNLWDLTAPNPAASLRSWDVVGTSTAQGSLVSMAIISPDDRWLTVADYSGQTFLFNLSNPRARLAPVKTFAFYRPGLGYIMAVSPDGCWLAYADTQGQTSIYWLNPDAPAQVSYSLRGASNALLDFSQPAPGQSGELTHYMVGAGSLEDHSLRVWDLSTLRPLNSDCRDRLTVAGGNLSGAPARLESSAPLDAQVLGGLDGSVDWAMFTPDNQGLVANDTQGSLRLWNLNTLKNTAAWTIRAGKAGYMTGDTLLSPDGRWLAVLAVSSDSSDSPSVSLRLWDLRAAAAAPSIEWELSSTAGELAFSADSRWLIINDANRVRLWSLQSPGFAEHDFPVDTGNAYLLPTISPDGRWLAAANDGAPLALKLWRLDHPGDPPVRLALPANGDGLSPGLLKFSPDGRFLAGYLNSEDLYLWPLDAPEPIQPIDLTVKGDFQSILMAFDPQSRWLALMRLHLPGQPGRLSVIDLSGPIPQEKAAAGTPVIDDEGPVFTISPDGRWLLFFSPNTTKLEAWDTTGLLTNPSLQGRVLFTPPAGYKPGGQETYDLSDDQRWLIHRKDNILEAWDISRLAGAEDLPGAIAKPDRRIVLGSDLAGQTFIVSPDGHWLLADQPPKLLLLDFTNPAAQAVELINNLPFSNYAYAIFSPDSSQIYYQIDWADGLSTVGLNYALSLAQGDLFRAACRQVGRDLTDAEIQQYLQGNTPWPVCKP